MVAMQIPAVRLPGPDDFTAIRARGREFLAAVPARLAPGQYHPSPSTRIGSIFLA